MSSGSQHGGGLKVLDLFSGIGGFSLGLERTGGFETVAFCEIDPFCRGVLARIWPGVTQYDDVRSLTAAQLADDGHEHIDVITGGFPCQDISIAGLKKGLEGSRSGLWSEIARLVGELRPRYVVVENVANLLVGPSDRPGAWFGRVLGDLADLGYDAEWHRIPASAVGAHFIGERVWIVASPAPASRLRWERGWPSPLGADQWRRDEFERLVRLSIGNGVPAGSLGRLSDGISRRVDHLRSYGNTVVPQVVELVGHAILSSLEQVEAAA
jgi:DNA (cytosine-5)-methyltransferase 1